MEIFERTDPKTAYARSLAAAEHDYLFGNSNQSGGAIKEMSKLKEGRDELSIDGKNEPIEEYYEAADEHYTLIQSYAGLNKFIAKEAQASGRNIQDLSGNEYAEICARFSDIAEINSAENNAVALYGIAGRSKWERPKIADDKEARLNGLNIQYQQAIRTTDDRERTLLTSNILESMHVAVDFLRPGGKRAEWELIYLINKWANDNDRSGVINIMHNDARTDLKDKVDASIYIGGELYDLQINTVIESGSDEYAAKAVDRKQKAVRFSTSIAQFPVEMLGRAFGKNGISGEKESIVNLLSMQLRNDMAGEYLPLLFKKNKTRIAAKKDFSKPDAMNGLKNKINADLLIVYGLLSDEDRSNVDKFFAAKNRATKILTEAITNGVISPQTDLTSPEAIELLKPLFR